MRRDIISTKMLASGVFIALLLLAACDEHKSARCGDVPDSGTSDITFNASASSPVTFAVIGDYGDGSPAEAAVARLVNSLDPDLIITTGDNNYARPSAESLDSNIGKYYSAYIFPYKGSHKGGMSSINRFFPSAGNHDWPLAAYLDYFELPGNERYYDFTWGPVHFFALSTSECEPHGAGANSEQAAWLRRKLAASDSPFRIVYGHHPPYSSGKHGSSLYMRWPFREWGADAFMAGHDHTYERLLVDGMPYFVVGLGGKSIYPFNNVLDESIFRYNEEYGALLVTVEAGRALFRFYNVKGSLVDEFEIVK